MSKCVVVFSGGQDSTTCLYWAMDRFTEVYAVSFDYGQRHVREILSAKMICTYEGIEHEIINLGNDILKGSSPLINQDAELGQYKDHQSLPGGLEDTFVPMRNQLFLTIAANRAHVHGCNVLVTGVSAEDFGGYPDCRPDFIEAFIKVSSIGTFTDDSLRVITPVMTLDKCATVHMALQFKDCYKALGLSHTSYDGEYPPKSNDHATLLRAKGFELAGVPDPLILRAYSENLLPHLPETANYSPEAREPYTQQISELREWVRGYASTYVT